MEKKSKGKMRMPEEIVATVGGDSLDNHPAMGSNVTRRILK
jgi:hypothetical protein